MGNKILVYRRGSIGDAIVSIPALNYLRGNNPHDEFRILTNQPVMERAAPLETIFGDNPICDGIFTMNRGGGSYSELRDIRDKIRNWSPSRLVYLSEPSSSLKLIREYVFFRSCGIHRFTALPIGGKLRTYRKMANMRWESEYERLLRAVSNEANCTADWKYEINPKHYEQAAKIISSWPGKELFIALSIGAKLPDKDWGDKNWNLSLKRLASINSSLGIMAIGSVEERERSATLLANWPGPVINLCGQTPPLISALVMKDAEFYLGHDSGPMHLAALSGVRCVAIFSARAKPGVWFPHGTGHQILYPWDQAGTVLARTGLRTAKGSIQVITPDEVVDACRKMFSCAV